MPAQVPELLRRYLDRILVVLGVMVLFWLWHAAFLEWGVQRYVATWMHDRIMIFLGVTVLLAVVGLVRSALATALTFPLTVIVGEVLGSAAWDLQGIFLGEEHEPVHAGWWIAVGLFAWVVLLSAWGEWRARKWERVEADEEDRAEGQRAR
ncbi:MAG: hypothetical protein Q4G35_10390 [Propionibacteriaceae bacterium]|nr:hypothetical protein [Propionibacteriaceae bacterium]